MEGTPDNGGGFTPTGEIPPLPIVLYNADTNNWECVSCVTTFQTESQLDAHLQLHNELGRSIITTTPTTPEKFSFDNPAHDLLQSSSFDAPDFDDFITEFEKITGGSGSGQDGFSSEQPYPLIVEDHFISGSVTSIPMPTATTTFSSTVINVPSVINPLLHLNSPPQPPPPPISQPLPPPPPPFVQIKAGPSKAGLGPVPQPLPSKPASRPRKRYQCSQCSKDFSRPSYLRKHEETTHHHHPTSSADVSKICPICSKAFSTQWHLTQHMKIHTSEMSYCCAHCGKEFSDRENMQKHMEMHKPEVVNPPPPKIMDQSFSKLGAKEDRDIAMINVVNAAASKFKLEDLKVPPPPPPPPPPVVDLEEETDVILETDLEPEGDDDEDSDGFECGMCDKIFETIKQLRIHERMMHEDKLMEVDKRVLNHHDIPNPQVKFNSIANTLLKNESLLRSMSMSRRNKRKRWSLSTMEKYEYCASLICDIKKKLSKALKILEPGSFDRRLRRKIKKRRRDSDNDWSCKVTSSGIKIYNQRKFQPVSITAQICTTNIYACIVCGLKVNSVTILKRHVLAEHANIIGGPPPSSSETVPEVRVRPRTPPAHHQKSLKSTFVGPLSKSPQKQMGSAVMSMGHPPKPIGTSSKTISPLSRTSGPLSRTSGPLSRTAGPLSKTTGTRPKPIGPGPAPKPMGPGPASKHMGPGPASKHMGPGPAPKPMGPGLASKHMGPGPAPKSMGLGPASKPMGPGLASKHMGPGLASKHMGLGPASKSMGLGPAPKPMGPGLALKPIVPGPSPEPMGQGPAPKPIVPGPALKQMGISPKPIGSALKPLSLPPKPMGPVPKPLGSAPKPLGLPPKPVVPASKQISLPPKPMGPPKPNATPSKHMAPSQKHMGQPPSNSMGPPSNRIGHSPQKSSRSDDDLIVLYQTINMNKSPTKSPLKPGTGKRTTNFAANQAKKKAERIATQATLEKAQLAQMESRDNTVFYVYPCLKDFEQDGIFDRVNIRDFHGIRTILGSSRAIVKLTTPMKSRPELPTPSQRKSELSLLNDKITIQSASEQARKDRRKSLLLNQPPPVKSSILTRSKSLIKMEKELRVVLTRIDDDSFDFTELLFLNKMC